jgi:hypothetical protein
MIFICLLISDVKGNHVNPDTVQTFSFAAVFALQVGMTVNEEYKVAKTLFGKCVSELEFCAYLSAVFSNAPAQSTMYFFNLTNKCWCFWVYLGI